MYTIGQVAEMFHLPISTLRYYDKEGLFPGLERKAGIRRFTEQELEALRGFELEDKPYRIAVCHVPFMSAGEMSGQFDIMPELYRAWNAEVERMAPEFMICGHVHWYEFYPAGDENAKFAHNYPVIVASSRRDGIGATAVIFGDGETEFRHIAKDGKVTETFTLPRK